MKNKTKDSHTENNKKSKASPKVFVAHYAHHTDCYKRASSYSNIIGVFKNKEDAIHASLDEFEDLLESLADDNQEFKSEDAILQRFADNKELSFEEECYVFNLLCKLQDSKEPEFTMQADGKYIEIDEVELQ
jgi:hypothetical protein